MKYIITKTLFGKFTYYLDRFNCWNGIIDNAHHFDAEKAAERSFILQKQLPTDVVTICQHKK